MSETKDNLLALHLLKSGISHRGERLGPTCLNCS